MAKRKRILVTGAEGMLGIDLVSRLKRARKYEIVPVDIDEMDLTKLADVKRVMLGTKPNVVIHCAAYTEVDQSEKECVKAMVVNSGGTKNLAFFCRELGAEMIYISTDYVFDGEKGSAYVEDDEPNPINFYGESKLAGERHIAALLEKYKICRTSWLCGIHGPNFIESILQAVEKKKTPLSVVNDQVGKPTFTFDLSTVLARLVERPETGIFHVTNEGFCSWYEFALEIVRQRRARDIHVRPITSKQFRSLATRPKLSVLEDTRLKSLRIPPLPRWEASLTEYLSLRKAYLQEQAKKKARPRKSSK